MSNLERRERLHRQIEQRRKVLAEWAKIGVSKLPEGTRVPRSLNQVRLWDEPRLGISRIGSPSSFTLKHQVHGTAVRAIAGSLSQLAAQRPEQGKAKRTRGAKRKRRVAALKSSLTGAANRYAVLSAELHETKLRLRVAEQGFATRSRESDELRAEVRQLKAALAQRSASGDVISIDPLCRGPA